MNTKSRFLHSMGLAVGILLVARTAAAQGVGGIQVFNNGSGVLTAEVVGAGASTGFQGVTEDLQSRIITIAWSSSGVMVVSRNNQNGTADRSFGYGGVTTFPGDSSVGPGLPTDVGVDASSRIYVVVQGSPRTYVVRFLPNGALDTGYNNGLPYHFVSSDTSRYCVLDVDGPGNTAFACEVSGHGFQIMQLDPFGNVLAQNLFTGFNPSPQNEEVNAVRLDSSGRVVVVGRSSSNQMAVKRFVAGQADPSFHEDDGTFQRSFGYAIQSATDAAIDGNGNVYVVGTRQDAADYSAHFMLIVLDTFGRLVREGDYKRGSNFAPSAPGYAAYRIAFAGGSLFIGGASWVGHSSRRQFALFKMSTSLGWDSNFGATGSVHDYISGYDDSIGLDVAYDPRTKNPVLVGLAR